MSSVRRLRSGGTLDPDHVQAVQQVLAEQPLPHAVSRFWCGRRGDHGAHPPYRQLPADSIELALARTATMRLQRGRHVADLVQEQRAGVGLLEPAVGANSPAPVKAPFSCPNNSDSSRSAVNAEVFSAMNGFVARGCVDAGARATSSLPVPIRR